MNLNPPPVFFLMNIYIVLCKLLRGLCWLNSIQIFHNGNIYNNFAFPESCPQHLPKQTHTMWFLKTKLTYFIYLETFLCGLIFQEKVGTCWESGAPGVSNENIRKALMDQARHPVQVWANWARWGYVRKGWGKLKHPGQLHPREPP